MTSRLNLKVVSLILGLVLWVYVNIVISPVVRRTVACTIELKNKPSLMNVISARDTAQVTLMGTRRDFIFAEKDSIKAVVDLYNLRPVASVSLPIKIITP
ncbi:hypothetical protein HYY75_06005, partial [bacterium]|nr:hypothetical protein [bacterium]